MKPFNAMPTKTSSVYILISLFLWRLAGAFGDDVKSVTEGDSVTLNLDLTETQRHSQMEWRFGLKKILIAEVNREEKTLNFLAKAADGRFRDRLKMDLQTGSLTITDTTTEHAGLYTVMRGLETTIWTFNLTVYAHLPVPLISSNSSQNPPSSSSVSTCVFLCSVVNVSHVTLSWIKGNSLLSRISVSDLNNSVSLHLECVDDSYSCVVNNPITHQTAHLNNTELCQPCAEDCACCCGIEVVIRLVLSALVGVVTVVILVYDIKTTSVRRRKSLETSQSN